MATTTDPPDLLGFTTLYGVRLCTIGEDGEAVIALGHPEPMRAVAAFNRYARTEMGLRDMLDSHHAGSLLDALDDLEWIWGRLATIEDCDSRESDLEDGTEHYCEMCRELAEGGWWLSWSTEPKDGSFPVVVWRP